MIEFIVGGARSGKTAYALSKAQATGKALHYIATATADDHEMALRIEAHKKQRGDDWTVHEIPYRLSDTISRFTGEHAVVLDCLTLWLSNWICLQEGHSIQGWHSERERALEALSRSPAMWFIVSNETGLGVIPMNELSRRFVDESGLLHQLVAAQANRVTMMLCGIANSIKP